MAEEISKKILLVDDEKDSLTYLTSSLERANYEVISTAKGKEAIDLAKKSQPDLIILDVVLSDMGGKEVAAVLSKDLSTASIPIIFLTGFSPKANESTIKNVAGLYTLVKPVNFEDLLNLITNILSN